MSAFHRFLAAVSALVCLHSLRATDLLIAGGTTTVLTDSSTDGSDGFGNFGYLDGASLLSGGTFIASGATLQLGDGQSRVHSVYGVIITHAPGNTFALLGPGEVVNQGTLLLNHQAVRFAQTGVTPGEPFLSEWWNNVEFRLLLSNVISGSGTLEQTGGSTLLTGANTYTGTTTISGGRLSLGEAGRLGSGALVITGGALDLGGTTATTVSSLTGAGGQITGSGTLHVDVATAATFSGEITGNARVDKLGAATLTLAGTSDNTVGSATVSTGVLELAKTSSNSVHAIGDNLTIAAGATARLAGTGDDQIADGASVVAQAGGTLDLNGHNETVGALSGNGTVTTSVAGAVTLGVAGGGTFGGLLTDGAGTLALVKSGAGTLVLNGANTYTGGTTLIGGNLQIASAGALGPTGAITFAGGVLQWSATNTADNSARFSTAAGQAYAFDTNSQNVTLATALTSAGGTLDKRGAGTLTLTGANSFMGITLTDGNLAAGSANALGGSGTISFAGGALQWTAANTTDYSARFATAANQAFRFDTNGQDVAFATALANSGGSLTKLGAGTLTLNGANALSGGTTVSAGALALANGGSLDTSALTVASGATFRTNGQSFTAGSLTGTGTIYGSLGNLNVNGAASSTFSGSLVQASIVQSGPGTLTLAGAVDNDGSYASVTGGTLVLAKDSSATVHALGTAQAHRIASGGTLRLGGTGGDQIYDGAMLNLESGGTLVLNTRSETIAGGTTLAGNVLVELGGAGRSADQAALTVTGATTLGGSLSLNLASGFALDTTYSLFDFASTIGTWSTVSLTGLVNSSLAFSSGLWTWVDGTSTYAFNQTTGEFAAGENPFVDALTISGVRTLNSSTTLGSTGTITFAGGTLRWTAANTTDYSARFSAAANQAFNLDTNGQHITLAAALASPGGTLTKLGAGTLTLSGANTYTGGTTISAGTLEVASAAALGSGPVVNHATLAVTAPGSLVFGQAIAGTGDLTLTVGGTVSLTGASTYTGSTYLNGGTVSLAAAGALGNTDRIHFNGGTLQWTAGNTTDNSNRMQVYSDSVAPLNEAFRFDTNGQNVTLATSIYPGVAGSLTKLGAGTLTLAARLAFPGALTVEAGTLRLGPAITSGAGSATIQSGAILDLAGAEFNAGTLAGAGRITGTGLLGVGHGSSNLDSTFTGAIDGVSLVKDGSGTFTLGGTADNSGLGVEVRSGTLELAKASSATVHAVTGTVYVGNSTLRLAGTGGDQIYDATDVRLVSGTLDLNGRSETIRELEGTNGQITNGAAGTSSVLTLGSNAPSVLIFNGRIHDGAGQVGLVKEGISHLKLQGASAYTGSTTVNGGLLIIDDGASLTGTSALILHHDAAVDIRRTGTLTVGTLTGSAASVIRGGSLVSPAQPQSDFASLAVTGGVDSTFSGNLSLLTLNKTGAGTLTLDGSSATANGVLAHVTGGTLVLALGGPYGLVGIGDGATHTVGAGATLRLAGSGGQQIGDTNNVAVAGTFDLNGRSEMIGWLTGTGLATNSSAGTLSTLTLGQWNADATSAVTFADGAGQLALVKREPGTLTLTGASTYTGGTTVQEGTLQLGNGGTSGALTGNVTLASGAALTFNRANAAVFAGIISGAGSITKLGAGTLTLSGANTYTGATAVNSGTLLVDGSLALTPVTVASGATLGGSGMIGGLTTIAGGGHLAPGNSPGTLTFSHGLTLNQGAILDFQLGTISDLLVVSGGALNGPATLGGITLNLSNAGGFAANTYVLFDFTGATLSNFSAGDFTLGSVIAGYDYSLAVNGSHLELTTTTAIPEPATAAALAGLGMLGLALVRRRRLATQKL